MSQFEQGLAAAKKRHRRLFMMVAGVVIATALGLGAVLVSAGGTRVLVVPGEAAGQARVDVTGGAAVSVDNVIYRLFGTVSIAVSSPGFRTAERQLTPNELADNIGIELLPLPVTVRATTTPVSDRTRWFINDQMVGASPILERELDAGTYNLRIDNPYYDIAEQEFTGARGETVEISTTLKPVDGTLKISTIPGDASIHVNDDRIGTGRADVQMPGGEHRIRIEKQGYRTTEDIVELTNTVPELTRQYRLRPVSARLKILVKPDGGELLLNGKSIAPGKFYDVASQTPQEIVYLKVGYETRKLSMTLKPQADETVRIFLETDIGKVDFRSTPSADVYIHGERVGTTPTTLELPAAPIDIELRKDGYRTIKKRITPTSQRTIFVAEQLQTEKALRLAASPPTYRNSGGVTLKRFQPGAFRMGAPRSEKGQRANEFLKSVELTKMFYAGTHEVTNGQFSAFSGARRGQSNYPVVGVMWIDAAKYCNWLSAREKLKPFYRITDNRLVGSNGGADGYRLLTEAEWEWLARMAGKKKQSVFPWGDDAVVPRDAGNIADESANGITKYYVPNYVDGHQKLAPVGSYPAEASGLYDITGNAREWVHDFYALTPPSKGERFVDPLGSTVGGPHVVKGTSWRSGTRSLLRAAYRDGSSAPADDIGFRIGRYVFGGEDAKAN